MKRPSFQFYPADWLGNSNLRRCSHAEKGVWLDVLCLMHDSEEYGLLRWPLEHIAQAVGCQVEHLHSLIAKGVMKGADAGQQCAPFIYVPRSGRQDGEPVTLIQEQPGPLWYSSRMVRDEYVVKHRGGATRFGSPTGRVGEWIGVHPSRHPSLTQNGVPSGGGADLQPETTVFPMEARESSPTGRVGEWIGEPVGDGSSSSTSSSREEGEPQAAPAPSQKSKGKKSDELRLADWLEQEKNAGRKAISDYKAVWDFADRAGIPREWVEMGWSEFKRRFTDDPNYSDQKQKDWRAHFGNYVRKGWLHLWELERATGQYRLTLAGIQLQRELESSEVAEV